MDHELRQECRAIGARAGCEAEVKEFWHFPPTPFDPTCVGAVREAAAGLGYPAMDIISGAGHDAVYMARVTPTAMIFVPCVGGISHNEVEDAKPDDLTAGCNVLLNAILETAAGAADG
jgi:N-carbamoyl-L-amino-acid hydrolase